MAKDVEKARYFDFILYLDSSPENRAELLESIGVPIVISPLHDLDLSDVEGQKYKKAHYHVIYIANNPVTKQSVRNKINRVLGDKAVNRLEIVLNVANMYAYLTHESKDAIKKKKHLYNKADLVFLNNFDIDRYITLSVEEKEDVLDVIIDLIYENGLANVNELRRFVAESGSQYGITLKTMNKVLRTSTALIRLYFDASYQERQNTSVRRKVTKEIDKETGEIVSD